MLQAHYVVDAMKYVLYNVYIRTNFAFEYLRVIEINLRTMLRYKKSRLRWIHKKVVKKSLETDPQLPI